MRLLRVTIDDFGLIAHAVVEFAAGLTVFSGETGSGKTMLLGALRFALGDRTEADLVRSGAARARVVVEIEPDAQLREQLANSGFPLDDDEDVVLARELSAAGRSQARINGSPAGASQLRAVAATIVDVVGQHDAQRLLTPGFALDIVDRFGGTNALAAAALVRRLHAELHALDARIADLQSADHRALAQLEFARYALAEIDAAAPEDDEDQMLRERRELLTNAERIVTALGSASAALEDEGGALDALGAAAAAFAAVARFGQRFAALATAAQALQSEINELAVGASRERELVDTDTAQLDAVAARLDTLERLKKKYGGSLAAVRAMRTEFAQSIEQDDRRDERTAALQTQARTLALELDAQAATLTSMRRSAARLLEARVGAELAELSMPTARFTVVLEPVDPVGPSGAERAELRLAANAGEPDRPIAKSASGGELSRVLLGLIVAIADRRERTALVFDEIDAGIGGAAAAAVGTRLARLAQDTQVIVVTHLAQIASWGQTHYALRKHEAAGTTVIELDTLGAPQARLEEIARMLSGEANAVALEHAATLVAGARFT